MNDVTRALDAIRRTELAAAQRVADAREEAEQTIRQARSEARRVREAGRTRGREAARKHFALAVTRTGEEAKRLRTEAEAESRALLDEAAKSLEPIVEAMVDLVLAPPSERGK